MLKKLISGVLAASMLFTAMPTYTFAVTASGSSVSYDDDDYDTPTRRSSDDERFIYVDETTTEATTVSMIVDQSGVSTPEGISANINIEAEGAAMLDAKTGAMLYGKHADNKMYPASMTKVMTLLVACENGNLDDIVTVSEEAVNSIPWDSSKAGLEVGETMTLQDLLYCVILVSGNDAAVVVAEHIAGSEEAFVEMMNKRAEELGCTNTHFVNPHGYHDENHYTTPHDMALIVQAASQNENAKKIWGESDHSIPATNKHEARVLNHSDKMLQPTTSFYDERIKGGKTGFHNQAMNTLASYAVNGEVELVTVVMKDNGYNPTYVDTKNLLDFGFGLYSERKLYGSDNFERILPVVQHYRNEVLDLGTVTVTVNGDLTAFTPSFINPDTVGISYDLPNELVAPVTAGQALGTLTVTYGDMPLGTLDIVPMTTVDAIPEKQLDNERRAAAVKKFFKTLITIIVVVAITLLAIIFGLRAWFISQRKRRNAKKRYHQTSHDTKKKKKIKIKFK